MLLSSILEKRKRDDGVGSFGCNKSKAPISLRALRQAAGLMSGVIALQLRKMCLRLHRPSRFLLLLLLMLLRLFL